MAVVAVAYAQHEFDIEQSELEESLGSAPAYKQTPYGTAGSQAYTPDYKPPSYAPQYSKPGYANGRVKIQTYRGPNKEYGKASSGYGYEDSFAPWGFYVNQPEDNKAYYGKY